MPTTKIQSMIINSKTNNQCFYYVFFICDKTISNETELKSVVDTIPGLLEISYNLHDRTSYIYSVYVLEKYRHKGIAKTLIKKAIDKAKFFSIMSIETDEVDVREPKENMFSKLGFQRIQQGSPEMKLEL